MRRLTALSWGSGLIVLTALVMRLVSAPTANLSYIFLGLYALLGRVQALQALVLSWLFTMISPGLAPDATHGTIGRYAVLVGAASSVLLHSGILRSGRVGRVVWTTLLLGVFICIHAIFVSPIPSVSVLKAVSWTVACSTVLSAWSGLSSEELSRLERQLFVGLTVLMLISLPLLGTGLGYLRNGTGFQGVLNHPQAFGPTMAVLAAWAGARVLTSRKPPLTLIGIFIVCVALIILSEARTAGFGLVLALLLAMFALQMLTRQRFASLYPAVKIPRFHFAVLLGLVVAIVSAPGLSNVVEGFVSKRGGATSLVGAYNVSRGMLMDRMQENIRKHTWTGIGFGIASDPQDMEVNRDPVLGLPISASIEKGVLPLAILEELGIPGAMAVLAWLCLLVRKSTSDKSLIPIALLFTVLLLNMGEMMLFSPGGMGLLVLVVVGFAARDRSEAPDRGGVRHG